MTDKEQYKVLGLKARVSLFFHWTGFVPDGFSGKVFNEAIVDRANLESKTDNKSVSKITLTVSEASLYDQLRILGGITLRYRL